MPPLQWCNGESGVLGGGGGDRGKDGGRYGKRRGGGRDGVLLPSFLPSPGFGGGEEAAGCEFGGGGDGIPIPPPSPRSFLPSAPEFQPPVAERCGSPRGPREPPPPPPLPVLLGPGMSRGKEFYSQSSECCSVLRNKANC